MKQFLESQNSDVSTIFDRILEFFQNDKKWRVQAEEMILKASNGEVRALQVFFNSPTECFSGKFHPQYLGWKDIRAMYPRLEDDIKTIKSPNFMIILHCNKSSADGKHGLTMNTVV